MPLPQQQQPVLPQQQQQQPLLPLLPNIPPMHAGGDSPERVLLHRGWYAEQRWFTELSPYLKRNLKNPTLVEMKAFGSTDAAMQHLYDLLKNKNESVHKLVGINNGLNKRLHSLSASFKALKKQCTRPKRLHLAQALAASRLKNVSAAKKRIYRNKELLAAGEAVSNPMHIVTSLQFARGMTDNEKIEMMNSTLNALGQDPLTDEQRTKALKEELKRSKHQQTIVVQLTICIKRIRSTSTNLPA